MVLQIGLILIIVLFWQTDLYDRIDQASLLRGEQLLKMQSLHTSSVDAGVNRYFSMIVTEARFLPSI